MLNLDALTAIDVHVHVEQDDHGEPEYRRADPAGRAGLLQGRSAAGPTVADLAEQYRARTMAAVIFPVDAELTTGHPAFSTKRSPTPPRGTPTC